MLRAGEFGEPCSTGLSWGAEHRGSNGKAGSSQFVSVCRRCYIGLATMVSECLGALQSEMEKQRRACCGSDPEEQRHDPGTIEWGLSDP